MNDRLYALSLFARVARTGSFSAAGREVGISQPTVSRIMAALEKQVGAVLLSRTTRSVTLTDAGADYYARAESILAAMDEADHAVRGTGELRGVLRIAMPTAFGARSVIPRMTAFTDQHPLLRVEFLLNDDKQNLITDGVDVAIQVGSLGDTSAVARKIGTVHRVLAASPSYLAKAGMPRDPADLVNFSIIVGPTDRGLEAWSFEKDGKTTSLRLDGRFILNGAAAATAAAAAGMGILSCDVLSMLNELESGALVTLLPDWEMGSRDMHVVLLAGHAAKPAAKAFADFICGQAGELEEAWHQLQLACGVRRAALDVK